jgi:hypothetical protein
MFNTTPKFALVAALALTACSSPKEDLAEVKFESAHSIAVDATIQEGTIVSTSASDFTIKNQITEQLMYTIGQMNGRDGGVDMNRLALDIKSITPRSDNLYDVIYTANLFVSWKRSAPIPENLLFIVPARGDSSGLKKFFQAYGSDEQDGKKCLANEAHDVSQNMLWYYYRPEKFSCSLRTDSDSVAQSVVRYLKADLSTSEENTVAKSPEHAKVWEDGKLVVTTIFGKATHNATSNSDAGIAAFRRMYSVLLQQLGKPSSTNLKAGQLPSNTNNEILLQFDVEHGVLDIHLYLIDDIKTVGSDFRKKYDQRTRNSDYISYNGHAGLGANIRALARLGEFKKDQWQLFLVNGCDTFAYVDDSLRNAHKKVNPEFGADKFVDVITNAMPAYFHSLARDNWAVIEGLLGKTKTYREILQGFDSYQRAAVTGEQDNAWPEQF